MYAFVVSSLSSRAIQGCYSLQMIIQQCLLPSPEGEIIFGDCIEFMQSMPNQSVDAIITDPPYLYLSHKLDRPFDERAFFAHCFRVLKKDSMLAFFGRGASFYKWNVICKELGFDFIEEVVWDKSRSSSPMLALQRCHELIAVWRKGKKSVNRVHIDKIEYDRLAGRSDRLESDVRQLAELLSKYSKIRTQSELDALQAEQEFTQPSKMKHGLCVHAGTMKSRDRRFGVLQAHTRGKLLSSIIRVDKEHYQFEHPTQKPLRLMRLLVKLLTNEDELVLDPFCGSGSTCLAAKTEGRRWLGIEIDTEYYKVAMDRLGIVI